MRNEELNMNMDELEVTLKMLDINYYGYGELDLVIQISKYHSQYEFIIDLLNENNFSYYITFSDTIYVSAKLEDYLEQSLIKNKL
jgi:hypothetical protein